MRTSCTECPLRHFRIFKSFTADDLSFMLGFKTGETTVEAGGVVLAQGATSAQVFTVLEGMGTRSKVLKNGRRQVINFVFPGDLVGLQASLTGEMTHSVEATTPMQLCTFRRSDLWGLFNNNPERAFDVTWITAVEEHLLGETIATLGQRTAEERIAWALTRLYERLRAIGLARDGAVPLPFRQQDLADALGLSLVHTNKTLRALTARGLARWSDGVLSIAAPEKLAAIAMIDLERPQVRPLL